MLRALGLVLFLLSLMAACTAVARHGTVVAPEESVGDPRALEMLDVAIIPGSEREGTVRIRARNPSHVGSLLGVDVRAEPGMWLAPARQQTHLFWLPPNAERIVDARFSFTRLSPEATLRVRVGAPEAHASGVVVVPEPVAVRSFSFGSSTEARAFLERFASVRTAQRELFALRGSVAAVELPTLAVQRERALAALVQLLEVDPPGGIRIVFYPDSASKTRDTRHIGTGYASGRTVVEILNDTVRLDPYHELAHMVAGQVGLPPAWLSEGFAVFASEHLGSDALSHLGSRGKSIDRAACEFARDGHLIPFEVLFGFGEIGPDGTEPHVSYAQSASFTGYLARQYGLERLREAYRTLSVTEPPEWNDAAFERAFGVAVAPATAAWRATITESCGRGRDE